MEEVSRLKSTRHLTTKPLSVLPVVSKLFEKNYMINFISTSNRTKQLYSDQYDFLTFTFGCDMFA